MASALTGANLRAVEVDEVVLVGGSSRLLNLRARLASLLQRERILFTVDPDMAVALGAASVVD